MGISPKTTKFGTLNCKINLMGRKDFKNRSKASLGQNQLNYPRCHKFEGRPTALFLRQRYFVKFLSDEKHFLN